MFAHNFKPLQHIPYSPAPDAIRNLWADWLDSAFPFLNLVWIADRSDKDRNLVWLNTVNKQKFDKALLKLARLFDVYTTNNY